MTKLVYPDEGISTLTMGYHKTAVDYLNYAYNQTGFDLPSSLGSSYRSYLYSLDDKIKAYRNEMNSIGDDIQKVNNQMDVLADELYRDVNQKLKEKKENERERLIR